MCYFTFYGINFLNIDLCTRFYSIVFIIIFHFISKHFLCIFALLSYTFTFLIFLILLDSYSFFIIFHHYFFSLVCSRFVYLTFVCSFMSCFILSIFVVLPILPVLYLNEILLIDEQVCKFFLLS
jgi:hypothetical protein